MKMVSCAPVFPFVMFDEGGWCGVVWCGVVWCGVVWCGVVWCGVVWCGVVWWWCVLCCVAVLCVVVCCVVVFRVVSCLRFMLRFWYFVLFLVLCFFLFLCSCFCFCFHFVFPRVVAVALVFVCVLLPVASVVQGSGSCFFAFCVASGLCVFLHVFAECFLLLFVFPCFDFVCFLSLCLACIQCLACFFFWLFVVFRQRCLSRFCRAFVALLFASFVVMLRCCCMFT